MKSLLLKYFKSDRHYWWTVGLLPGLYMMLYLYRFNFFQVNSLYQFFGLSLYFLILPSAIVIGIDAILKRVARKKRAFFYFLVLAIQASAAVTYMRYSHLRPIIFYGLIGISIILAFFMAKHYKKAVFVFGLMLMVATVSWIPFFGESLSNHSGWIQKSKLENLSFIKKPNIYLIQPDGYASSNALRNSVYDFDNSSFEEGLLEKGFSINENFRSNYPSTLTSNAALFTAQHHYMDYGRAFSEMPDARDIIIKQNPVLEAFDRNGYATAFFSSTNYLRLNYTDSAYGNTNVTNEVLSILPQFRADLDYHSALKSYISKDSNKPRFTFIEFIKPGHVPHNKTDQNVKDERRLDYLEKLKEANTHLNQLIKTIEELDPEAIVIIAADHGGFVGYNYSTEVYERIETNAILKQSIFGSLLAVKAPDDFKAYQNQMKSSISVFPNLFNYLSGKVPATDLDHSSYLFIDQQDVRGIYRYYDRDGNSVTEQIAQ